MIDTIDHWLANVAKGNYNAAYYNKIVQQFKEFGQVTTANKQTLKNIIERCVKK